GRRGGGMAGAGDGRGACMPPGRARADRRAARRGGPGRADRRLWLRAHPGPCGSRSHRGGPPRERRPSGGPRTARELGRGEPLVAARAARPRGDGVEGGLRRWVGGRRRPPAGAARDRGAGAAWFLFDIGVALQALEARRTAIRSALSLGLIAALARRRRWLAGTLVAGAGWPFHVAALTLAPLSVVQPALALGLLLLLALGDRMLGERVGPREVAAVVAIVVGVTGMAWAAPSHVSTHAG